MELLLFTIVAAIATVILKFSNLQNWLISAHNKHFLVPRSEMYYCSFCLQFWLTLLLNLVAQFVLLLIENH